MKKTPPIQAPARPPLVDLRVYQKPVFWSESGVLVLHWSRQIGKSYTLAAWAVYRLLTHPGRLVTVLSNSKSNGAEFIRKCTEVCLPLRIAFEQEDISPDELIENMRVECRIKVGDKWGRILVLAANPRTARGFSGDLILDEFAFHEDSEAIWDAAEPIISSNRDYLCRVASTGNGRYNKFYQLAALGANSSVNAEGFPVSQANCPVSRVPRSLANGLGVRIFDPATREEITPAEARRRSLDKRSYDQNYECSFNDENMALLTLALISAAEYDDPEECRIEQDDWSLDTLDFLRSCRGPLGLGLDVGRNRDLTCIFVGERAGGAILTRALLRVSGRRLPDQLELLRPVLRMANFGRGAGDATGLGLGLVEFAQEVVGRHRFESVHFASREARRVMSGVTPGERALVTELMALDLLQAFEARNVRVPCESALRDALRKPERIQTAGGVRIAAERDGAGHADEFWSLALLVRALNAGPPAGLTDIRQAMLPAPSRGGRFTPRRLVTYELEDLSEPVLPLLLP
jgi:phage FluMu gp28-like protein